MKELLCLFKMLVVTDKLVRCLKCIVKALVCAVTVLTAVNTAKLLCDLKRDKRKHRR